MVTTERALARPLKELVPSIRSHIKAGKEAAKVASALHYVQAGAELHWARPQVAALGRNTWAAWLKRNFNIGSATAGRWMELAKDESPKLLPPPDLHVGPEGMKPKSLSKKELRRLEGMSLADLKESHGKPRFEPSRSAWQKAARESMAKVNKARLRLPKVDDAAREAKLRAELAKRLVDIGFKSLAVELHPDKGGSAGAMARLNGVRKQLLEAIR